MNSFFEHKVIFNSNFKSKVDQTQAVFLDRDGVIIEDRHYIKDPSDVKFCPGAKKMIRLIFQRKIPIIIVTNQSGISKNYLSWEDYKLVTKKILEQLEYPNPISAIYANSYLDTAQGKNWRKPNPNMILTAAKDLNINLESSILIGDRYTDLQAGIRSGIKKLVHVKTGYGASERTKIIESFNGNLFFKEKKNDLRPYFIENLLNFPFEIIE